MPGLRRLLTVSFAVSLLIFLPTLNFLAPADANRYWLASCLFRVLPVGIALLCLAVYGAALAGSGLRRGELVAEDVLGQFWPSLRRGSAAVAALAAVLIAVYLTAPTRLWTPPDSWSRQDRIAHFEDMLGQKGLPPDLDSQVHRALARCYLPADVGKALQHYARVGGVSAADPELGLELGDRLVACRRYQEARACYSDVAKIAPHDEAVLKRLANVDRLIGK